MSNALGLTKRASREWFGSWSPDGTQILFSSDRDGNENLFVVAADGSTTTQLTTSEFDEVHGMWSLDAQSIAYAYNVNGELLPKGDLNMQVMNADGTNPQPLEGVFRGDPIVSPDGDTVAFVSNESGKWQIYTMNPDGTNVRRITPDDGNYLFPVWQP
jgi:TolB protein